MEVLRTGWNKNTNTLRTNNYISNLSNFCTPPYKIEVLRTGWNKITNTLRTNYISNLSKFCTPPYKMEVLRTGHYEPRQDPPYHRLKLLPQPSQRQTGDWLLLSARRLVAPYKLYRKLLNFCTRSALKITKQLFADWEQVDYEGLIVAATCTSNSASNQPRRTVPEIDITTANLSSQLGGCLQSLSHATS